MHASCFINSLAAVAILIYSVKASAIPAIPRDESSLDPWVSVDASGLPVATITPVLTTVNGVATTISAAPATLTATTTSQSDSKPSQSSGAPEATSTGGGSLLVCNNMEGEFAPFCKPSNGSDVYVTETYYVTWDSNYFNMKNASIMVQANFVNISDGGAQAFQSSSTPNGYGFISWTIDKEILRGKKSNNVTLNLIPVNPLTEEAKSVPGPTVRVTTRPADYYRQEPAKAPKGQSLYIALPTVFGFIILCLCGGFFLNRKHRTIGLGNVMGRRKGYGVGKSRTQRLGLGRKKKDGAILLREQELRSGPQYKDAPPQQDVRSEAAHARSDSDTLGSLAGSPTEERPNYLGDMRWQVGNH